MSNPTVAVDHSQVAAKHRAMWASGDYAKLAAELVSPLGPVLVQATGIAPGDRVLDVAAGTGNAADSRRRDRRERRRQRSVSGTVGAG